MGSLVTMKVMLVNQGPLNLKVPPFCFRSQVTHSCTSDAFWRRPGSIPTTGQFVMVRLLFHLKWQRKRKHRNIATSISGYKSMAIGVVWSFSLGPKVVWNFVGLHRRVFAYPSIEVKYQLGYKEIKSTWLLSSLDKVADGWYAEEITFFCLLWLVVGDKPLLFGEWNNENFIPTFIHRCLISIRLFVNFLLKLYVQEVCFRGWLLYFKREY